MTRRWPGVQLYAGLAMLAGCAALLAAGAPFMKTWFYCFAWWSLLLALDGWKARRTGQSFFFAAGREFLFSAFLSVPVWLIFELFNLRLKNWSYHGLPPGRAERWAGYFLAFATVIPALKILAGLIRSFGLKTIRIRRGLAITPARLRFCIAFGSTCLALTLVWPKIFFPLVWLGFAFLVDPLNYRRRRPSLVRGLEEGEAALPAVWMLAGLAAGILWELLNFWAGSHWEYHIPYLNFGRIFQMPVFGFGGFPPFALEIFAMEALAAGIYGRLKARPGFRPAFWAALAAFDGLVFHLIDMANKIK